MKPYEWMVKYTRQTDWIDGTGLFTCGAFFLASLSGGLYLASLYFNNLLGMFIAWVIVLFAGIFDMLHLGKPLRFWRIPLRPQTSWISRGLIFIVLFIGFAFIQLILSYWSAGTAGEVVFKVLAGIMAFAVLIYTGFALNYVNAIKFWNSALVPVLIAVSGLLGGLGILLAISSGGSPAKTAVIANIILVLLVVYAITVAIYLWSSTYIDPVAKDSVASMVRGSGAPVFWIGLVLLGIIAPLLIFIFAASTSAPLITTAVIFLLIGGFSLRYSILKAGQYGPLIPTSAY